MILSLRKFGDTSTMGLKTIITHPRKNLHYGSDDLSVSMGGVIDPIDDGETRPIPNNNHAIIEMIWGPLSFEEATDFRAWWREPV